MIRAARIPVVAVAPTEPMLVTFVIYWCNSARGGSWGKQARQRCDEILRQINEGEVHRESWVLMSGRTHGAKNSFDRQDLAMFAPEKYLRDKDVNVKILGILNGTVSETKCAMRYIWQNKLSKNVVLIMGRSQMLRISFALETLIGYNLMPIGRGLSALFAGQSWNFLFVYVGGKWSSWIGEIFHYLVDCFSSQEKYELCHGCKAKTVPVEPGKVGQCWLCWKP